MCCCFKLKSSGMQRKKLQLLIRSFLPLSCQVAGSDLLLPGVFLSLFPVLLAANWSPLQYFSQLLLSVHCSQILILGPLFAGHLQHPDSYDPGSTVHFTVHLLEMPHSLVKALLFSLFSLVLSSVTANPQDCTHHFFLAGKEFLPLFIC